MTFTPLAFGSNADPITAITTVQTDTLLACGPLDIGLLNGLLKTLADRIDSVDAADNAIVSATYNPATNVLTFSMADGPTVDIPLTPVIADAVATGLITSSSYNAATNVLTLTTANGDVISIDLTAVIGDAVATALAASSFLPKMGMFWFDTISSIPAGWHICDGSSGTPDLRDRFIIGAGGTYPVGSTGGAVNHDHGGATAGHALTRGQLPIINDLGNGVGDQITTAMVYGTKAVPAPSADNMNNDSAQGTLQGVVEPFGNNEAHTHGINAASNLPPYMAYPIIMKL